MQLLKLSDKQKKMLCYVVLIGCGVGLSLVVLGFGKNSHGGRYGFPCYCRKCEQVNPPQPPAPDGGTGGTNGTQGVASVIKLQLEQNPLQMVLSLVLIIVALYVAWYLKKLYDRSALRRRFENSGFMNRF